MGQTPVIQAPRLGARIMRYELADYEWTAIRPIYKPLYACVDRTFINPNLSGRRPENLGARTDANNGQSLAHTEWPARRLVVWCYSTSASLGRGVSTSAKYVSMSASREKWNREKAFNRSHL